MTSSDPFRFGPIPIANVVKLRCVRIGAISPWDGFGLAFIATARSRGSQEWRMDLRGREDLDRGLKNA